MKYKVRLPYIVYCDLSLNFSLKLVFLTIFQCHSVVGPAEGKIVCQHLYSILPALYRYCLSYNTYKPCQATGFTSTRFSDWWLF